MLTVSAIGRVTADLEQQRNGTTSYVRFSLAVNKGYGAHEHTLFPQCVLFDKAADRIINAKVKKGSLIWVSGDFDIDEFERLDKTRDKSLKIVVNDWGYIAVGKPKQDDAPTGTSPLHVEELDGNEEQLP